MPQQITLHPVGSQWMIKSLLVDGREMAGQPLDFAGRSVVSGIQVMATDRLTLVAGEVKSDRGQPLKDHLVVLLRTDAGSGDGPEHVRTIWTDDSGKFQARGLRPGEYVAGVVEDLEPGYHFSPEFQARLRAAGRRFVVDEIEPVNLELTPTRDLQ